MREVFHRFYEHNLWGDPESVSGPGSSLARTASFRDRIVPLLKDLGASSLLDAGCGDFNWLKEVELPCDYVGMDVVPELIERGRRHDSGRRRFIVGDITRDPLPRADVILCRDCLAHFSIAEAWKALRNFKKSRSRYLLATTFIAHADNADIPTGGWWPINLECPPFDFPAPQRMIDEKCLHTGGIYADKRLALWNLADIPG